MQIAVFSLRQLPAVTGLHNKVNINKDCETSFVTSKPILLKLSILLKLHQDLLDLAPALSVIGSRTDSLLLGKHKY
jgi:hypothetical protein